MNHLAIDTTRRVVLRCGGGVLLASAGVLAGCAAPAPRAGERLLDLRSGGSLSAAGLVEAMRASDVVLLGERHDNARHHALRGALVEAVGPQAVVVAEHLPRGARLPEGVSLEAGLRGAGFDAMAWQWPLHEPLFAAVVRGGVRLVGGNLAVDEARRIARAGESAWDAEVATVLRQAPLAAAAQRALDADLLAGHCGHLSAQRLPAMRAAQRARDAAMWLALRAHPAHPAILVAGNAHVRLDYGVGQLIDALQPQARRLSVGFLEADEPLEAAAGRYTHVWVTAPLPRVDPCTAFGRPAAR